MGKLSQLFLTRLFLAAFSQVTALLYQSRLEQPDPAGGRRLQILIVSSGAYPTTWTYLLPKTNYERLRMVLENSSDDFLFQSMGILMGETEFSGLGQ